jgi:hypothetical protein
MIPITAIKKSTSKLHLKPPKIAKYNTKNIE